MKPEDIGAYYESILDREVRREQGIYYTPPLIVDYMVSEALYVYHNKGLQPLASENKGINPLAGLSLPCRIVDPACGAGVFLLGAYQFLLDWHEKHFGNGKASYGWIYKWRLFTRICGLLLVLAFFLEREIERF